LCGKLPNVGNFNFLVNPLFSLKLGEIKLKLSLGLRFSNSD
jgi:hypothetical protein